MLDCRKRPLAGRDSAVADTTERDRRRADAPASAELPRGGGPIFLPRRVLSPWAQRLLTE